MTLSCLVSDAARRAPDAPALFGWGEVLTWADVDERTARLAVALVEAGESPGDRVAVARNKGVESFLAVHAILRAGAVVVPLDPLAPVPALQALVRDAEPSAVLSDASIIVGRSGCVAGKLDLATTAPDLRVMIATGDCSSVEAARVEAWDDVVMHGNDRMGGGGANIWGGPSNIRRLDAMPTTASGKIDRTRVRAELTGTPA
jgi:acyl-CoA synthetase (AMP-forming)/AMP-acid ligase II